MKFKRRMELTTGWAEWDELKRVWIGDRLIPQRITVTMPSTADKWPALTMTIEVRGGAPVCTEVSLKAHPEGREIRALDLTAVDLESWVENVVAEAAVVGLVTETGETTYTLGHATEEEFNQSRQAVRYARQNAKRKVTHELLTQVADIYRANLDGRPIEAIRSAFTTSHRTAARYAERARKAGLLPPTTQGKVKG